MKKYMLLTLFFILINLISYSNSNDNIHFKVNELKDESSIILIINPDNGEIIEYSDGAIKFYGYNNLKNIKISDINTLSEKETNFEMSKVNKGEQNYFHFKHRLTDNSIRDVYVNSYRMYWKDRLVLVSTIRDVTDEIRTEKKANMLNFLIIAVLLIALFAISMLLIIVFNGEKRYQGLFENMLEGFALHEMIFDENGDPIDYKFIAVNPYFEKLTGLKKEKIVEKTVLEVMPDTERYWIEAYGNVVLTKEPLHFENYSQELNKYFSCYAFYTEKNKFAVIFSDVTKERKLLKELESEKDKLKAEKEKAEILAVHDSLTNLPNRRLLQDRVENSIHFAKRNETKLAICVLDLDDFKQINDKFGHPIGDEVLKMIASRSTHSLREYDTISRIGGDEFVMLITNFITVEQCEHIVERVIEANKHEIEFDEFVLNPTFSLGVAIYPEHGSNFKELIKNADLALYEAKRSGKNKYNILNKQH